VFLAIYMSVWGLMFIRVVCTVVLCKGDFLCLFYREVGGAIKLLLILPFVVKLPVFIVHF